MFFICHRNRLFYDVFEFSDISGIIVFLKFPDCLIGYHPKLFAKPFVVFFEEALCQNRNIIRTLSQSGNGYVDYIQSVIKVFSELALPDQFLRRLVHRGDNADGNRYVLVPPDSSYVILLQDTQKLALQFIRHGTDFVKQQGSSVCLFKQPGSVNCSGEAALCRAEQNPFQQSLRNRRTVLCQKWPFVPRSAIMDALGEQFFTRPRFAVDENARIVSRSTLCTIYRSFEFFVFSVSSKVYRLIPL